MFRRMVTAAGIVALGTVNAWADVSNGFDSDFVYSTAVGAGAVPTNTLNWRTKLTMLNATTPNDELWQGAAVQGTAISGTFKAGLEQSLTFSYAQRPGLHTPAGYRLFTVAFESLSARAPIIRELDSSMNILRDVYLGRVVNGNADFGAATPGTVSPGGIRYNARNNTLLISVAHDGVGTGGTSHLYIYEISLPDSPAGTGVDSPHELDGCMLMETYDTGLTGPNTIPLAGSKGDFTCIDVAPAGVLYFRNQNIDGVFSFSSTAGGFTPGGTTSGPTIVVANAALNAVTGQLTIGTIGQWQAAVYQPSSNSLINLQRKTGGNTPSPVMVKYDLTSNTASLIAGSTGYRGQNGGVLDVSTGTVWVGSATLPTTSGGLWKYASDGTLAQWDNASGVSQIDVAVPPSGDGACCKPAGGGCVVESHDACTADNGVWQGPGTSCEASTCVSGACCLPGGQPPGVMAQSDCVAAGGFWQGPNTTPGQNPCPLGACCGGCGSCTPTLPMECSGNQIWAGPFTQCGQVACPGSLCAEPPVDGDCDGDVDIDDFGVFQRCYNPGGPIPAMPGNCGCFDLDHNGMIDNLDFDLFVNCATRDHVPAAPCP